MYTSKKEALGTAISKALKYLDKINVLEVISVDIKSFFKENGQLCHSDELEYCTNGKFEAQIRHVVESDGILLEKADAITGQYESNYTISDSIHNYECTIIQVYILN